jgi:hypothetical protein
VRWVFRSVRGSGNSKGSVVDLFLLAETMQDQAALRMDATDPQAKGDTKVADPGVFAGLVFVELDRLQPVPKEPALH